MIGRATFHLAAFTIYAFGIYYDVFKLVFPETIFGKRFSAFGGRWKYLTFWNVNLQCYFFLLSFIYDIYASSVKMTGKRGNFQALIDWIFAVLAVPMGIVKRFVFMIFWSLWAIDRELVFPRELDNFFPSWLNHVMHTIICPVILFEIYVVHHQYPSSKSAALGVSTFTTIYVLWTFIIAYSTGFWTYPILQVLNWWQRGAFIIGCITVVMIFYLFGQFINDKVWGKKVTPKKEKKKRGKAA